MSYSKIGVLGMIVACAGATAMACPPVPESDAKSTPVRQPEAGSVVINGQRVGVPSADTNDPRVRAYIAQRKQYVATVQELRKIKSEHFGTIRTSAKRQAGLSKMSTYTDPLTYPAMVEVMKGEGTDVKRWMIDHFVAQKNDAGDAGVAWLGIYDRDESTRQYAGEQLRTRLDRDKQPARPVQLLIADALSMNSRPETQASAAQLASSLELIAAIPSMINAQITRSPGSGGGGGQPDPDGDLAWIVIGTQTAFISNVTPVVGQGAVGFNPTVSTVTEGVVLKVKDAVVTIRHNPGVNTALVGITSRASGQETAGLGYDLNAWAKWYNEVWTPMQAKKAAEASASAGDKKAD